MDTSNYNSLSILLTISIDSRENFVFQLSMEGFYIDPFTTQQNDCEMLANKRPTRVPWKRKRSKVHCEFFT